MSYMLHIKQLTAPGGHVTLILVDQHGDEAEIACYPGPDSPESETIARTRAAYALRALADKIDAGEVVVEPESWFESLSKPDRVGSAEYRAIYELLESVDTDESRDSILEELESQLQDIRKLQRQQ